MSNKMLKAMLASCLIVASVLIAQSPDRDKRLLFLTHAGLYKHASLGPAERAVTEWGADAGFEVTGLQGYLQESSDLDLSVITAEYLAQFDGLMMFTNGNLPLDDAQRLAITDFVKGGKGFIGVHSASLTLFDYPEYGEMLGAYFRRPISQNRVFVVKVEDPSHPATRMLGPSWPLVDELYLFGNAAWRAESPDQNRDELFGHPIPLAFSRDRVRVLLSLDTERSDLQGLEEMGIERGGDYPQAWCRTYGRGRSFYTALGHREDIWTNDPVFRAHVTGGIRWALGLEPGDAQPRGQRP